MSAERVALADLALLPGGRDVEVAGRVLACSEDGALLEDASGRAPIRATEPLAPGNLYKLAGRCRDGRLHVDRVTPLVGGESVFRGDSDHARLAGPTRPLERLWQVAALTRAVRLFFDARDYLEVDTPLAVPSPGLDLHLEAFAVAGSDVPRWLITSPEYQMKRLLSAGAERIYQLARCFRRDESGPLHEPEFRMLEWYRAHADMNALIDETEALVRSIAEAADPQAPRLHVRARDLVLDASLPFERLTVREAFARYAEGACADTLAEDEAQFFEVLVEQIEPQLGLTRPTFLTHYPASMASLARLSPEDPSVAERFELYVGGVELCNGFGELTCADEQRRRLLRDQDARRARGLTPYPVDERFLDALRDGVPPCAGNALGLDRLFMLALDLPDIQAVSSFPSSAL